MSRGIWRRRKDDSNEVELEHPVAKSVYSEYSGMQFESIRRPLLGGWAVKSETPIPRLATDTHIGIIHDFMLGGVSRNATVDSV